MGTMSTKADLRFVQIRVNTFFYCLIECQSAKKGFLTQKKREMRYMVL